MSFDFKSFVSGIQADKSYKCTTVEQGDKISKLYEKGGDESLFLSGNKDKNGDSIFNYAQYNSESMYCLDEDFDNVLEEFETVEHKSDYDSWVSIHDKGADGKIDKIVIEQADEVNHRQGFQSATIDEYDEQDNYKGSTIYKDFDFDNVVDEVIYQNVEKLEDKLYKETNKVDSNVDGVPEKQYTVTIDDRASRVLTYEYDDNMDGVVDWTRMVEY